MKKIIWIFLLFSSAAKAQDTIPVSNDTLNSWRLGGTGVISFSQTSFSNWAAGGVNTMSLNSSLHLFASYYSLHSSWENNLDMDYGLNRQNDGPVVKSDDRLELSSKYGWKKDTSAHWGVAALLNFRTQFRPGYDNFSDTLRMKISDFMSPAYITFAPGVNYQPNKNFSLFISPATVKMTIVQNDSLSDSGAYGVEPGENIRTEIGGFVRMEYRRGFLESTEFFTRLDLFSNYFESPGNIDVNWETSLLVKLNKFLTFSFGTLLIYDHDIDIAVDNNSDGVKESFGPRTQFRQMFGAGLSFKI